MNTQEIKDLVSVKDVCNMYGFKIDRKGFMRCIFHNEKTASMKVYEGNKGYYCFGCGAGGDVIDFMQRAFNLSFIEAISKLNNDFNLGLDINTPIARTKEITRAEEVRRERHEEEERKRQLDNLYDELCEIHRGMYKNQQKYRYNPIHPIYINNSGWRYQLIKYTLEQLFEDIYINECYKDKAETRRVLKSVIDVI